MSLDQLIKKLKPVFLAAASNEHRPFRLFLSASDMKARAIVRHASADTPADAWTAAVDNLKAALGNINPTILRADWVVDEEQTTWAEFLTSITQIQRNYYRLGLALDADFNIAFIEPELTSNAMLYRDGANGDPNCVFNEERCNGYCQARFNSVFPTPDPSNTIITFTTAGAFASDVEKNAILLDTEGLATDHRPIDHTDDAAILKLVRNGAAYFATEIKKKDQFLCDRYPCVDKVVPMRVPLKHFNFITALLDVYETYGRIGNSSLGAAITKALQFGIKSYVKHRTLADGSEAAYVVSIDGNDIRLGANGAALIALAKHSVLMKTKKYTQLMDSLARGILSMQNDDGSFAHALKLVDYTVKDQVHVTTFDGLAILGLIRLHALNGDQKLLDAAERAFTYFIINEMWKLHDPLLVHAVDLITRHLPKREYFEFGIKTFVDQLRPIWHQMLHDPRSLELLIAADILIERLKSMPDMSDLISDINVEDLHATLERQMQALIDAYFYPEFAMFFKRPDTVVDAFFLRHESYRVMVLDMEFLFSGAVAYRQYLERRTSEPQPSASLLDEVALIDSRLTNIRQQEAVSELMTPLDRLARRLKAKFLEVAGKNSYQPCRVFLSASSMQSRAVTRHASDPDPAKAWTAAVEKLRSALGTIQPTILRADFVVDVESTTWAGFIDQIGKTKRNYFRKGLALDQNFALAFTESELNANIMLFADGDGGSPFCVFRQDRSDEYCRRRYKCDFPTPAPSNAVYLFSTNGTFIADDLDEPLLITDTNLAADHRDIAQINDALVLNCVRSGADHLALDVQDNGQFIYGRFPCTDKVIPTYNTGRHFSSLYAMLEVYGTYAQPTEQSERLRLAIERGLEYGIQKFIVWRQMPDGAQAAYAIEPKVKEAKLGTAALVLLAFSSHAVKMKTDKYLPLMNGIAEGIISMQKPDGSFVHVLHSDTFEVKNEFRIIFFDGEAIFGLMRLYSITHDARLLEASERTFQHFVATDHWQHHDHWLSYAINELTIWQPKREYFEFGINNFLALLPYDGAGDGGGRIARAVEDAARDERSAVESAAGGFLCGDGGARSEIAQRLFLGGDGDVFQAPRVYRGLVFHSP